MVAAGAACAAAQTLVTVKDEFVHSGYAAKDAGKSHLLALVLAVVALHVKDTDDDVWRVHLD